MFATTYIINKRWEDLEVQKIMLERELQRHY